MPPVLIVGAGPAGLFAAYELARYGVPTRIVERLREPHHESRATAIQPAGLEPLARAGLDQTFLKAGARVRRTRFIGPGMNEITTSSFDGIGSVYEFQCSLPQWRTEEIFTEHLQLQGRQVERGIEVESIENVGPGLLAKLRHPDGSLEPA